MKLEWHEQAIADLKHLRNYIARERPSVAVKIGQLILKNIKLLMQNPALGRIGRVPGTRELVISGTPYIVPYRVQHNTIQILRVFHSSMPWPDEF